MDLDPDPGYFQGSKNLADPDLIDWLIGRPIYWLIDGYKGRLHASWGGSGSTEGIKIKGRREETSQNKETKKIFGKGERFVNSVVFTSHHIIWQGGLTFFLRNKEYKEGVKYLVS